MSKVTAALEAAVAAVVESTPGEGVKPTSRQRANVDRAFAQILKLIAPRIRHFVRQYGLTAHFDDAEQCCAIAVHRAIQAYDPAKAQFTTFVNWQIRGELQSLRFRLMTDQRPSAKKVEASTISLHSVAVGPEGEETMLESLLVDAGSLEVTEAGASDYLAKRATAALVDEYMRTSRRAGLENLRRQQPRSVLAKVQHEGPRFRNLEAGLKADDIAKLDDKLARDREILERRVFGDESTSDFGDEAGITKERIRQISKRATKAIAELAATADRFQIMAELSELPHIQQAAKRSAKVPAAETLLPNPAHPRNVAARVVAIEPIAGDVVSAAHDETALPVIVPAPRLGRRSRTRLFA
jgi:RNA polymerase sigma-32 factor